MILRNVEMVINLKSVMYDMSVKKEAIFASNLRLQFQIIFFRNKLYKARLEDMDIREEYSIAAIAMATMLIAYSLLLLMFVVYCIKFSHQIIRKKYDLESSNEFGNIMDWSEDNSRYSNKISCQDDQNYLKRDSIVSMI